MKPRLITENSVDRTLDLTGLECPLPVLKTKKALSEMAAGTQLHATTTDPLSVIDFRVFCERSGHQLVKLAESDADLGDQYFEFLIKKNDAH